MLNRYYLNHTKRNFSIALIWIKGGSDMDCINKKGINKVLCSLLTRGCKGFDNFLLSEFIESYGAELNQEVFEDGILISIKSLNEHFSKLLPLLDLIINKPILSEIEFKKAKKSSIDLLKKEKENPFSICFEKWRKIVYSNHPYAFNTIGNENDVSKISYPDILYEFKKFKEREKYLISNNLAIDGKNIETLNEKISKESSVCINNHIDPITRCDFVNSNSNQTIIMIGNQTCSRKSNEYWPLKILESYLSFGMSAALFQLFRERNGITYDLGVFYPTRNGNAPFVVYLSVSNNKALLAFELLSSLWKDLLLNPLIDDELHLAKEKLKGSFLFGNQSLEEILQRNIQLISYGISPLSEVDISLKIDEISSLDILRITRKYLSKPFLSIYGNKLICSEINKKWNKSF